VKSRRKEIDPNDTLRQHLSRAGQTMTEKKKAALRENLKKAWAARRGFPVNP
jgi:hypothetical protein